MTAASELLHAFLKICAPLHHFFTARTSKQHEEEGERTSHELPPLPPSLPLLLEMEMMTTTTTPTTEEEEEDDDAAVAAAHRQVARCVDESMRSILGARKAAWRAERAELRARVASLAGDNAALDARCAELEERNMSLQSQLRHAEAAGALSAAETRKVRGELDEVRDSVEGRREALRAEMEARRRRRRRRPFTHSLGPCIRAPPNGTRLRGVHTWRKRGVVALRGHTSRGERRVRQCLSEGGGV